MDIQSATIRTIQLNLSMSEDEARAILVDPSPFQAQLRSALKVANEVEPEHSPKQDGRKHGRRPKGQSHAKLGKFTCPDCQKSFNRFDNMVRHRSDVHGVSAPAAPPKVNGHKSGFAKEPCRICSMPISKAQMRNHLRTRHGIEATDSNAVSAAAS